MWPTRLSHKQEQGRQWEEAALSYLQRHGLVLIEANFRCKLGEIDLILHEGATLVFVEVRQRALGAQVTAAASISPAKIRRILRAAQCYLQGLPHTPPCRIDVIAIDGQDIEWLRDAIQV
jgi:putative endonuclease